MQDFGSQGAALGLPGCQMVQKTGDGCGGGRRSSNPTKIDAIEGHWQTRRTIRSPQELFAASILNTNIAAHGIDERCECGESSCLRSNQCFEIQACHVMLKDPRRCEPSRAERPDRKAWSCKDRRPLPGRVDDRI